MGRKSLARNQDRFEKSDEALDAPLSIRDEQVVGMSEVHMLSFTATVMDDKGPSGEAFLDFESSARRTKALLRVVRDSARVA